MLPFYCLEELHNQGARYELGGGCSSKNIHPRLALRLKMRRILNIITTEGGGHAAHAGGPTTYAQ